MKNSTLAAWRTAGWVLAMVALCLMVHLTFTLVPVQVLLNSLYALMGIGGVVGLYHVLLARIEYQQLARDTAQREKFPTIQE
jgi:hypothetical protein